MSVLKTKEGAVVVKGPIKLTQSNGNILEVGTGVDKTVISNGWTGGTGDYLKFEVPSADNEGGVLQLNSNGNVGIGTTAPSAPLSFGKTVYGAQNSENFFRVKIQDQGGVHNDVGIGQTATGNLDFNFDPTGVMTFNAGTAGERLRITSAGNVGIGNDAPAEKLHVSGTVKATSFIGDGSGLTGLNVESEGMVMHSNTINNNMTIPTGKNAVSGGPIEIGTTTEITISQGSTWTIV